MPDFETEFDRYYANALDVLRRSGSIDEAYAYIRSITDDDYRNSTFSKVASFLGERGELAEALRFCISIVKPLERTDALFDLSRVLVKQHSYDAAKGIFRKTVAAAEAIEGYTCDTAAILLQVAEELEQMGEQTEALDLLHRAIELAKPRPQDFGAGKTLRGCARALAKWNRLAEAVEVAEEIELPQLRATALEEIHGRGNWPVRPGSR